MHGFSSKFLLILFAVIVTIATATVLILREDGSNKQQGRETTDQPPTSVEALPASDDPCAGIPPQNKKITDTAAIRLAECFIIQNGYTDLPPLQDKSKLTPEPVFGMTDDEGMQLRHDSLERKAYEYAYRGGSDGRWIVVFRRKYKQEDAEALKDSNERLEKTGRAVRIDDYGKNIRMEHQDIYLHSGSLIRLN